jgi:glycerophosphoryl diester phosphodiesterase
MHDLLLDETTNVAELPQFSDRKTTRVVDGNNMTGFFVNDFVYDELMQLRLKQRLTFRTDLFDGYFSIPSFDQIMQLAQQNYNSTQRTVGIYPELKHPSYFHSFGFEMEDMFLRSLTAGGYQVQGADVPNDLTKVLPVVVQCFEENSLRYIKEKSSIARIFLVETSGPAFWSNNSNLAHIAEFANAVGPEKSDLGAPKYSSGLAIMKNLHAHNLRAHPWTFRADDGILKKFHNDFATENMYFYCCLGMDGLFTEFPDRSRESIDMMHNYTAWSASQGSASRCIIDCSAY